MLKFLNIVVVGSVWIVVSTLLRSFVLGGIVTAIFCYAYVQLSAGKEILD